MVKAPTLLIVGGNDPVVLQMNEKAAEMLLAPHEIQIISGATHLFEEPGKLEQVAQSAMEWFERHIRM
jgi:alpha-beta hydrolase superfamily lysophospholipase